MGQLFTDIRSGVRMLVKYPTLSLVAILTLGLGIGMSTTVFCIVNGGLFGGLPFPDADRLVAVVATNPSQNQPRQPISVHDLVIWQARQTSFETLGAYAIVPVNLSAEDRRPERFSSGQLTVAAFAALGVQPVLGRGFRDGDDRAGSDRVILLGHELWRDRYGSSASIIGQAIRVNGQPHTVIGVMPEKFGFPLREVLWTPLVVDALATPRGQGPNYQVVAKLKPGVRLAQARTQAGTIAGQLAAEYPTSNRGIGADVMPYAKVIFGPEIFALLYTMLGAGIGVLLIACVNVSNLLVARASLRRREVAVRMALGAGRQRVVRQHLTEVLVLAVAGGGLGVLLSIIGMRWFVQAMAANPPPFWITFELDSHVMLFVLGLIVLASLFAGAVPAMHSARVSAGSALKDDSRSSTSARLGRFSSALVVAELAVSCGLLIAAGLMIKSVVQLKNLEMPFAVPNVLTARVDLPREDYADSAASIRFFELLLPRLRELPGVEAATLSDGLPAAGNGTVPVQIQGKAYAHESDSPLAREGIVTPGYFETFQTPVHRGREFTVADNSSSQPVAIINESFSRLHFAGVDPIGAPVQAQPSRLERAVDDDRGRGPRSADAGHRQQQREPGRLLHSDFAKRCRQRRPHGGADLARPDVDCLAHQIGGELARSESRDLSDQHDELGDRTSDLVLHGVQHVLHDLRDLRAVPRGGGPLRRDVVRRHPAHPRDGRPIGARRPGTAIDPAGDAEERHPAGDRADPRPGSRAARVWRLAARALSRQPARRVRLHRRPDHAGARQPGCQLHSRAARDQDRPRARFVR